MVSNVGGQNYAQQSLIQQAKTNARLAQEQANSLSRQAERAQKTADQEQSRANELNVRAKQAKSNASAKESDAQNLSRANSASAEEYKASDFSTSDLIQARPVVNPLGQLTGRLVNTRA